MDTITVPNVPKVEAVNTNNELGRVQNNRDVGTLVTRGLKGCASDKVVVNVGIPESKS